MPDDATETLGRGRLRQLLGYAKKVFRLDSVLGAIRDRRVRPQIGTDLIARAGFLMGLLRVRSFNAFEPKLAEPWMQRVSPIPRAGDASAP